MKLMKIVFLSLLLAARVGIATAQTPTDSTSVKNDSITWSKELDGVVIKAQKQLIKQEIDRIAYDVQSDEESKTQTVMDMLRKVPMVTVDGQDNILVKGNSNFKVYKNGHLDPSLTKNAKEVLKSMPTSMVKRIEVITDPGAREDAEGVDAKVAGEYATVVENPAEADLILYRTTTVADRPAGMRPGGGPGGNANAEVNIDFPAEKWAHIQDLRKSGKPVVVAFNPTGSSCVLPPAVKTDLNASLMIFDVFDKALLDVVFGKFKPVGKLPFEVPSSMDAVRAQLEDVPFDSKDPTFAFDHGLTF